MEKQSISLEAATTYILEECRMVLPGIQALFGFQLIAVFNEGFGQKLTQGEQRLHFVAILLVTIAIALVMAPAAVHRQTQQREVSERFIWLSSRLVLASMAPLVIGLCIEIYLISRVIVEQEWVALLCAAASFVLFLLLWVGLPRRERQKQA
jgi:uncharacterized PurR-regulated membrane protein YhhQ (DUF165 family)